MAVRRPGVAYADADARWVVLRAAEQVVRAGADGGEHACIGPQLDKVAAAGGDRPPPQCPPSLNPTWEPQVQRILHQGWIPPRRGEGGGGRACFHDPLEPQVAVGRMNGRRSGRRSGPDALPPLAWCQAVLFDRERNQVVKGASLALPLEFPAEQMELVACELQLKLQRSHLANS